VDHTSAVNVPAPPSTKVARRPPTSLENYIGLQVAAAAAVLLQMLAEFGGGGVSPVTKNSFCDLIGELFELQRATVGYFDFDVVAHKRGIAVLRENDIPLAVAEFAVDEALAALRHGIKLLLN